MIAFSCRPHSGSEWGVGWNYLRLAAAAFDEVALFVRDAENQIGRIREQLAHERIGNVEIVAIRDLAIYPLFKKRSIHARFLTIYYLIWVWKPFLILMARREWRRRQYLLHVTWVSDWIFSPAFLLPFRRRIVGPLGSQAANFNRGSADFWFSRLRQGIKTLLRVVSPNFVSALRASAAIGISRTALERYPWRLSKRKEVISPVHCELVHRGDRSAQRKMLFVGKQLPFKNLDLFLIVAERLLALDPAVTIDILGDTMDTATALDFAQRARHRNRVTVHGVVPLQEVARYFGEFQSVLLQTSSETGGTVGVEALTMGVPVVCTKGFGIDAFFAEAAYPYAVRYANREQYVTDSADMIARIFADYERHSKRARGLSGEFSWDASLVKFMEIVNDR